MIRVKNLLLLILDLFVVAILIAVLFQMNSLPTNNQRLKKAVSEDESDQLSKALARIKHLEKDAKKTEEQVSSL